MQLCRAATASFPVTLLVNKPPTVKWTNQLVRYQLRMNCIITEEQQSSRENQYLSKNSSADFIVCVEKKTPPTPGCSDKKTFIFINDSPCTLLFFVGYMFSGSHLSSFQSSRLSQILTGRIIATFFLLGFYERRGYKNYTDSRLGAGCWSFLGVWLFIDFSISATFPPDRFLQIAPINISFSFLTVVMWHAWTTAALEGGWK